MKRYFNAIRRFFFPPADASPQAKILPYLVMVVFLLFVVFGGRSAWTYTDSSKFCGTTCHSMPPEYVALQTSSHAGVNCIECHVDPKFDSNAITRKIGMIRHLATNYFKSYEYPIRATSMRPSQETCERCHTEADFSDDNRRTFDQFESGIENSSVHMILKTSLGTMQDDPDSGIHWHIKNQVFYYPTDDSEQVIPYVKVVEKEFSAVYEYIDTEVEFDLGQIQESDLKDLDCITCHNRTSHANISPDKADGQANTNGSISYPNNLGHQNDPGCFRCHDGKHLNLAGFAIRLECNLCHTIPVITGPDESIPQISFNEEEQPHTHRSSNWITLHRYVSKFEENIYCSSCHEISKTSSSSNSSFCSNTVCHNQFIKNLNFDFVDNGSTFQILVQQLPHYPTSQAPIEEWETEPTLETVHQKNVGLTCLDCHEDWPPLGPPPNEVCIKCHGSTKSGLVQITAKYEPNPHDSHYGEDTLCTYCHKNFGPTEAVDACGFCHAQENIELIP